MYGFYNLSWKWKLSTLIIINKRFYFQRTGGEFQVTLVTANRPLSFSTTSNRGLFSQYQIESDSGSFYSLLRKCHAQMCCLRLTYNITNFRSAELIVYCVSFNIRTDLPIIKFKGNIVIILHLWHIVGVYWYFNF